MALFWFVVALLTLPCSKLVDGWEYWSWIVAIYWPASGLIALVQVWANTESESCVDTQQRAGPDELEM